MSSPDAYQNPPDLLDTVCDEIWGALEAAVPPEVSFAAHAVYDQGYRVALEVNGIGLIGLPVSTSEIERLLTIAKPSHHGRGEKTVLDAGVRSSSEVVSSEYRLAGPDASLLLCDGMIAGIMKQLDISCRIEAVPHKLLIYQTGDHFAAHKDTQDKHSQMFGTAVLCLPSKHTGGALELSHGQLSQRFSSDEHSEWKFSWAAWFADVSHAVTEVTSGYRLALVYNLVKVDVDQGLHTKLTAHDYQQRHEGAMARLISAFSLWRQSNPNSLRIYGLEHQATEDEISWSRLKGRDYKRAWLLRRAAEQCDFMVVISFLNGTKSGGLYRKCGYEEDDGSEIVEMQPRDEAEWDYEEYGEAGEPERTQTFTISTGEINVASYFEENQYIQDDPFPEGIWKRVVEPTGNSGVSASQFYRSIGLVILPGEYWVPFLMKRLLRDTHDYGPALGMAQKILNSFRKDPKGNKNRAHVESLGKTILEAIATRTKSSTFSLSPCGQPLTSWMNPALVNPLLDIYHALDQEIYLWSAFSKLKPGLTAQKRMLIDTLSHAILDGRISNASYERNLSLAWQAFPLLHVVWVNIHPCLVTFERLSEKEERAAEQIAGSFPSKKQKRIAKNKEDCTLGKAQTGTNDSSNELHRQNGKPSRRPGDPTSRLQQFRAFAKDFALRTVKDQLTNGINTGSPARFVPFATYPDAPALLSMARYFDISWLETYIIPLILAHQLQNTAFTLRFLIEIDFLSPNQRNTSYHAILPAFAAQLSLEDWIGDSETKSKTAHQFVCAGAQTSEAKPNILAGDLAKLVQIVSREFPDLTTTLFRQLERLSRDCELQILGQLMVPMLKLILNGSLPPNADCRDLATVVLRSYLTRCLEARPASLLPTNWKRSPIKPCSQSLPEKPCGPCEDLNFFLVDPDRQCLAWKPFCPSKPHPPSCDVTYYWTEQSEDRDLVDIKKQEEWSVERYRHEGEMRRWEKRQREVEEAAKEILEGEKLTMVVGNDIVAELRGLLGKVLEVRAA